MVRERLRRVPLLAAAAAAVCLGGPIVFGAAPDAPTASQSPATPPHPPAGGPLSMFATSHECQACHNGLTTPAGEDVSIGLAWRASMMANSSRDPYWQAGVRREVMDHPGSARAIEDECAICHMPMSRAVAHATGGHGAIFAHLPIGGSNAPLDRLAADGVSCTVCHQIGPDRLGTRESFTGGFVIAPPARTGDRRIFGPFAIEDGQAGVMRSATGMTPAEAAHVRESELCATCHTLYTQALGPDGKVLGELPEQVPYLEWRHSDFRRERSCQACHMPEVAQPTPIASVLGEPREGLSRHTFIGGNFFMLRMLNRYRHELGVEALPQELERAAEATLSFLGRETAALTLASARAEPGTVAFDVAVENLTGHKLPTAYPSRRVWLHVTVTDAAGVVVFESGAVDPSGRIRGNDNDDDASKFEPHYTEIRSPDQVQIYESVMHDADGVVTTGLLRATGYLKDNRLLPRGFDKATAPDDVAVIGGARDDPDFTAPGDRVRYVVSTAGRSGPFRVAVELRYQPIAFRWARNLRAYDAMEPQRFVRWYDEMSSGSSAVLARASLQVP